MSGIYIPGTVMPTRCYTCPCADLEYYDCNLIPGTRIEQHKRLDDCPLVPVPEHGDLIDRDKAVDYARENDKKAWEALAYAPTIIPADPAKEGEG